MSLLFSHENETREPLSVHQNTLLYKTIFHSQNLQRAADLHLFIRAKVRLYSDSDNAETSLSFVCFWDVFLHENSITQDSLTVSHGPHGSIICINPQSPLHLLHPISAGQMNIILSFWTVSEQLWSRHRTEQGQKVSFCSDFQTISLICDLKVHFPNSSSFEQSRHCFTERHKPAPELTE